MNKTTLNSQKEKHSMLSLRRATTRGQGAPVGVPYFYPRSPCGERHHIPAAHVQLSIFLSTLSLRRATKHYSRMPARQKYFYPRSPCGERRNSVNAGRNPTHISIHALLAESDWYTRCRQSCRYISIHALLAESDDHMAENWARFIEISIHALLAESDRSNVRAPRLGIAFLSTLSLRRATSSCSGSRYSNRYFYPRSPCGERQSKTPALCQAERFLSTLSLRRATVKNASTGLNIFISIHALLAESDNQRKIDQKRSSNFYPRSPCGERLRQRN